MHDPPIVIGMISHKKASKQLASVSMIERKTHLTTTCTSFGIPAQISE